MINLLAMNDGQIRFSIILVYLGLLLGLGFFASRLFRGTKNDYLLASHSIGPFLLLMSMFGTTMTAFALVGSPGFVRPHSGLPSLVPGSHLLSH